MLERHVVADGHRGLAAAVARAGGRVVDWSDEWWTNRVPQLAGPVVFHGSLNNADRIARELSWSPGALCTTANFACHVWWPVLADLLVSEDHELSTVQELVSHGPPASFGDRVFVRPDSALKPFSGRVLARTEISLRSLDHGFYYDDLDLPVLTTPVTRIGSEWRFVVVDGEPVAGSRYQAADRSGAGEITGGDPVWQFAAAAASRYRPDPVFVLDVCETPVGLRVLELNPFSGADLYDCDRDAVVEAVHGFVAPRPAGAESRPRSE